MNDIQPRAIISQYVLDREADISGPVSHMEDEPDEAAFIYENVEEALETVARHAGLYVSIQGLF